MITRLCNVKENMSERIEILGTNHVQHVIEDELGWIWRSYERRDYGIDGVLEIADELAGNIVCSISH